ncbi:MAG TPA: HAMP domain-containing sensor histidine kinase [Stellaceae bacterium]|jgi:signal transduction histidine kinase
MAEHIRRGLPVLRLSLLTGMLLYGLFGILDLYIVADRIEAVWLIRYAVVCPTLFTLYLTTYVPAFVTWAQPAMSLAMMISGAGIVVMTAVTNARVGALYYAGLIPVVIYCTTCIRLRWQYSGSISAALFIAYQCVALFGNPIPIETLLSNDSFLVTSIVLGVFANYVQELYIRRYFISNRLLLQEKARSDQLLTEAQAADRAKGEFLAVMSHELRTPLNAIIGFADVMKRRMFGPIGSERYLSYVDDIYASGSHLLGIINDILDLSKADAGKLALNEEEFDLAVAVDQSLRLLRDKAAEGGVRLAFEPPPPGTVPRLLGDLRLVKQVIINLVSNAIKFTQSGGAVTVHVDARGNGAYAIHVADTGIGIAPEDIGRVLEPFVQIESAFSRKRGGTGLGLPLAKKILELHGGTIAIESALGAGTTVTACFPADRFVAQPAECNLGAA